MIGSTELIAILVAALFLFGPNKLPELARSLGSAVGEFKKAQLASEMQLTHFDSYTQKAENKSVLKDQEEGNGKNETIPNEKDEKLEVNP
jgi:sec-independent protein translocase protein TatA